MSNNEASNNQETPSSAGTPFQSQTPHQAADLVSPSSATPGGYDFMATPDYARFNTPHANTVGFGRQYANPAIRNRVFTSDQSSPLSYPGGYNPPSAPRVTQHMHVGPEELPASELETPRRSFQRGDIHPSTLTFEGLSPAVGSTPYTPFVPSTVRPFQDQSTPTAPTPGQAPETPRADNGGSQVIWGTTVNIHTAMNDFQDFLNCFSESHLLEYQGIPTMDDGEEKLYYPKLIEEMKETQQVNLNLDCLHLLAYPGTNALYHQLKRYPQEIIPLMDFTLTKVFVDKYGIHDLVSPSLRVRPFNLCESVNMRELNPSDIDQLVTIKGLLIRASHVLPDLKTAFFKCFVCDHTVQVGIDRGVVAEPTVCPRQACQSANSMQLIHNRSVFADKQICKLQETPDSIPDGQTPHSVSMCVYDELVDAAKPGDRLEVTGIFRSVPIRVNPRVRTIKALFRTYIDVVHIKTVSASRLGVNTADLVDSEQDPALRLSPAQEEELLALSQSDDLYQRLSHSLAPSIFGLDDVKKGILLQLFGGSNARGTRRSDNTRGDIHVLLVGDPGTSKSQLLQYAHRIAPRGMYTSGRGSSAVGLTAYITRDPDTNQLVLESGALVLSDGGVCCIDEFDKMGDSTRSILHEVMEQQTVSVAKAGIITTLNARTSILACANPINSQWMRNLSVPENINLPPSLLSRFDLVYLMLDTANADEDRRLARHLVSLYLNPADRTTDTQEAIPTSLLTRYIAYAKARVNPVLNEEAGAALVRMYVELRQAGAATRRQESRITATTRQLESMIRLAEAHARMRLQREVQMVDVEEAFRLIREAIKESATDPRTGLIDWDILATGHGSRSRRLHQNLKAGLVELLGQRPDSSEVPLADLLAELNRRAAASGSEEVSAHDLTTIASELQYQGLVQLSASNRRIRRTFPQGYTLPPIQN
ncbi:MCM DNA helicase complex subunit [Massospora cicadina]|nr:MCM DNA helicase complex subunit [Massospora cicadina]